MNEERYRSFGDFYPFYLSEHSNQVSRRLHFTGTSIAVWDTTIWQRDPGGTWRIAVDISAPLPRQDHDQPA